MSEAVTGPARTRRPRIDLLAAMGIVSWLPRKPLPGAPAAPTWRMREQAAAGENPGPGSVPVRPGDGGRALAEARRLIADPGPAAAAPPPAPATTAPATTAPAAGAPEEAPVALRFELQVLRPGLALLMQWPAGGPAAAQRAFAMDVVHAMGVVPEALAAPLVLDWQGRAGTSGSLRDAVAGFLAALDGGRLVALGPDPRAGVAGSLPANARLLELPSIPSMIAEPGRKADAWKRLAHFLAPGGGDP